MMKLKLILALLFVILNISWVLDGLLSTILGPSLVHVVMAQV